MKLYNWLRGLPAWAFIPMALAAMLLISFIFYLLDMDLGENTVMAKYHPAPLLLIGCILVPLVETALLQLAPIEITLLIRKNFGIAAVIISAVLFALTHWFTIFYLLYAFLFGIVLGTSYIIWREKKSVGYAFLLVTLIHALWNTFIWVVEFIEDTAT